MRKIQQFIFGEIRLHSSDRVHKLISLTIPMAVEIACTELPTKDNGPLWLLTREMVRFEQNREKGMRAEREKYRQVRDIINATYIRRMNGGTKGLERILSLLWKCHSQAFHPSATIHPRQPPLARPFHTPSH